MKLRDLLPEAAIDARQAAIDIAGLAADSSKVKPGFLFIAIAGAKADGAHFAKQAAASGAAAVVAEQRPDGLPPAVAFIQVDNARRAPGVPPLPSVLFYQLCLFAYCPL